MYRIEYVDMYESGLAIYGPSIRLEFVFSDRSAEFQSQNSKRRNRPNSLPDPHLISVHATLYGIFRLSGAGRFLDELLSKYSNDDQSENGLQGLTLKIWSS